MEYFILIMKLYLITHFGQNYNLQVNDCMDHHVYQKISQFILNI